MATKATEAHHKASRCVVGAPAGPAACAAADAFARDARLVDGLLADGFVVVDGLVLATDAERRAARAEAESVDKAGRLEATIQQAAGTRDDRIAWVSAPDRAGIFPSELTRPASDGPRECPAAVPAPECLTADAPSRRPGRRRSFETSAADASPETKSPARGRGAAAELWAAQAADLDASGCPTLAALARLQRGLAAAINADGRWRERLTVPAASMLACYGAGGRYKWHRDNHWTGARAARELSSMPAPVRGGVCLGGAVAAARRLAEVEKIRDTRLRGGALASLVETSARPTSPHSEYPRGTPRRRRDHWSRRNVRRALSRRRRGREKITPFPI